MKNIVLVDLPTFPKGTISLSLSYVGAFFSYKYSVTIVDLNVTTPEEFIRICKDLSPILTGLKVSSQNYHIAVKYTDWVNSLLPECRVIWGGEFPTLQPEQCLKHVPAIVSGLFDTVAGQLISDLENNKLLGMYKGGNEKTPNQFPIPLLQQYKHNSSYNRFMGLPLETTRGCTEVCTFCMVHVMQKKHYHTKPAEAIKREIEAIGNNMINIIDYNFGVNKQHVISTCNIIEKSGAIGFTAEMCLDLLDDEELLIALQKARCKIIYCGLETIQEDSLKSVHKMNTNHIENYRRIIAKAQQYGIQIASGFILAMEGTKPETFKNTLNFFEDVGIMYVKLTFLTYNPGTKAQLYYQRKGTFTSSDPAFYDGNHLSYLPANVDSEGVYGGTKWFIENFYSEEAILRRSRKITGTEIDKQAFINYNICYSLPYHQWIDNNIFENEKAFKTLLATPYSKPKHFIDAEEKLLEIWSKNTNRK